MCSLVTVLYQVPVCMCVLDQIMDKMINRHLETEVKVNIELEITVMTI